MVNIELENARSSLNMYHQSSNQSVNGVGAAVSQGNEYDKSKGVPILKPSYKDLQQIDIKLQNMLQFMNDFATNF